MYQGSRFSAGDIVCDLPSMSICGVEELIFEGRYVYYNNFVNDKNFPIELINFFPKKMRLVALDPNVGMDAQAIIKKGKDLGLRNPSYEDALHFGASCFQDCADPLEVVFLHEPWKRQGKSRIIVLRQTRDGRHLCLDPYEVRWKGRFVYAAFLF